MKKMDTTAEEIIREVKEIHLHFDTHLDEAENMFCPMCIEKTISLTVEKLKERIDYWVNREIGVLRLSHDEIRKLDEIFAEFGVGKK